MALKEYKSGTAFPGVIGRTFDKSSPAWPEPVRAKEGAPNVLFIVLDDTGYGQLGCFGGPCETSNLDVLAIDMVPTVLEALGIEPPTTIKDVTQSPIEGVNFAHTFDNAQAATKHLTQYFEMMGHRSIYHDGWRAVCPWPGTSLVA